MSTQHDDLRSTAVRAARWTILEKWGSRLMSMLVFSILARYVAPSDFGLLAMAAVVLAFLTVFVDSGFARTLVQQKRISDLDVTTAFWTSVGLSVLAYVVVYLAAPLVETLYDAPGLADVLRVMAISVVLAGLSGVPAALLEREFQFRGLSLRVLAGTAGGGVIGVSSALAGAGVWALVAQTVSSQAISLVTLWLASDWRPSLTYSLASLRRMASFGVGVMTISLMNTLQSQADKFLIGLWLGPSVLGYYYLAQRLLILTSELVTTVISRLSLTTFSKVQDDLPRLNRGFLQLTFLSGAIGVPIFGLLALYADLIVPTLFGDGWTSAVPLMQIFCASFALGTIIYFDKDVLLAIGRPGVAVRLGLAENVIGIAVLCATAPLGATWVAVGRAAQRFVIWPYRMLVLRRCASIAIATYLRNIVAVLAALLPAGAVFAGLSLTGWSDIRYPIVLFALPTGLLLLVVYFGGLLLMCGASNRQSFLRIARTFVSRGTPAERPATAEPHAERTAQT